MLLPKLHSGVLVKRYKRFLADVHLKNGQLVTAHCPNTGSMLTCSQPGSKVYLSSHNNSKRKYRFTWELVELSCGLVGINTFRTNKIVAEGLSKNIVKEFKKYVKFFPEPKINKKTRLDFLLRTADNEDCYLEIKNCTFVRDQRAQFPDAPTKRGRRHLEELIALHKRDFEAAILFLVQRRDAICFSPARQIDPAYAQLLEEAFHAGVKVLAYDVRISLQEVSLNQPLPIIF